MPELFTRNRMVNSFIAASGLNCLAIAPEGLRLDL